MIERDHAGGFTDPTIEPIVIGNPRPLGPDSVFFNAIFRADRQEPITAALLGMTDFIRKQATQKKRLDTWDRFSWLTSAPPASMWTMIDYHLEFRTAGAASICQDSPHPHNILHLLNRKLDDFTFLLVTEGVKEKHMGLFSRGRRSTPLEPAETQRIIASCGREEGVNSDNDLYKVPAMRHEEIAADLVSELEKTEFDLVAANFPGADMLGHLVENHFEACIETLLSLEKAMRAVVPAALNNGWLLILTSDHGNIEHLGPDHGNNDVLTTLVIPENSGLTSVPPPGYSARLFDISWTVLETLGLSHQTLDHPPFLDDIADDPRRLVGRSLIAKALPTIM